MIATSAAAADVKYFNGAFCRVGFNFGGGNISGYTDYSTNGSVANMHPMTYMNLVCPIPRDNTSNNSGWDSVEIGYFDTSPDAIACTAYSASFDGTLGWNQTGFSSDNAGAIWKKTGMILNADGTSVAGGFYFIKCVVPPAVPIVGGGLSPSGIAYYRVQEP